MLQIGHPSLIPVGVFCWAIGSPYMLRRLQKCHTPKTTKNMEGLHTGMGTGGVALARPASSQIYFPIGDAVASRSEATQPVKPQMHPAG